MYFLAIFVAVIAFVQCESPDKEAVMAVIKGCKESTGWTGDMHSDEITKERKCFQACTMKKFGIMTAEGKLDKEKALERGQKFMELRGKTEEIQKFKDALEQCFKEVTPNADHCETAFLYDRCFKEKKGKH